MNATQPAIDWHLGSLEARLRFWSTVPGAEAMRARIEAEIKAHCDPQLHSPAARTSSEAREQ